MPGFIGFPELLLLGLVVLLVFGPKRLPEMGRSMGKGLREFKDSISGSDKDDVFAIPTQLNDGTENAVVAAPVHEDAKVA
jgi:sec-independent protein translocase protein TatA